MDREVQQCLRGSGAAKPSRRTDPNYTAAPGRAPQEAPMGLLVHPPGTLRARARPSTGPPVLLCISSGLSRSWVAADDPGVPLGERVRSAPASTVQRRSKTEKQPLARQSLTQ
ncbi:hypothetical protein NDU88_004315 [Pleurodeles waltl]|uniref:Uncharacterized protein n=1 Tax=Pleurodeles waltl TaxID=8319 RepID=A0AAV7SIH1_PLEWA|nr:hypothetical protein NDU88_004315 [Pleurodeles waltl]